LGAPLKPMGFGSRAAFNASTLRPRLGEALAPIGAPWRPPASSAARRDKQWRTSLSRSASISVSILVAARNVR
jgi:hypothetical protein